MQELQLLEDNVPEFLIIWKNFYENKDDKIRNILIGQIEIIFLKQFNGKLFDKAADSQIVCFRNYYRPQITLSEFNLLDHMKIIANMLRTGGSIQHIGFFCLFLDFVENIESYLRETKPICLDS